MTQTVIIFDNGQGGVGVIYPAPSCTLPIEQIAEKDVPQGAAFAIVDFDDVDRTFRDAWVYADGSIHVDIVKAREIWRDKMRVARGPIMDALDIQFMRAIESGDDADVAAIKAKKQALRDVTDDPRIDAAQTYQELKTVWPEVL